MKKFKSGFTLAEVLITLAIIGIVAAIILPSTMTSYQYKTVGVKLAKFMASLEGASRAYAVSVDNFGLTHVQADGDSVGSNAANSDVFLTQTFIPRDNDATGSIDWSSQPIVLKDGTSIQRMNPGTASPDNPSRYGQVAFNIAFYPNVQGLPSTAQSEYDFAVTELGYVFPDADDGCLQALYQADFKTREEHFKQGSAADGSDAGACYHATSNG